MTKTILLTGGTGKVGKALLQHFSSNKFNVIFTSRSLDKIKSLEEEFPNSKGISVDFYDKNCVDKIIEVLSNKNIEVDFLINNARNLESLKVEDDGFIKPESWLNEYNIDVVVPYELTFKLAKLGSLKKVINISSIYGLNSFNPNLYDGDFKPSIQYATAKAGLIQLTKCLAVYLADQKIQVNCISYGGIEGRVDENFKERYAKLCPEKRMMSDNEAVGAVEFLISDNSTYITGQNIIVDGGWSIW